jgi:hypothetical protein
MTDTTLQRERRAVLDELKVARDDPRAFETILLDFADVIVDNPARFPVTLAYTLKHKPKRNYPKRKDT